MATNFPTSLDTLTNPTATDKVSTVDHASQHANANDAIEALQAKVGINSSTVTSSFDYKLTQVTGADYAVGLAKTQTLTNKTLTSPTISGANISSSVMTANTNNVLASSLKSATTSIDIASSSAPTNGQTLIATSTTSATWQTPSTSVANTLTATLLTASNTTSSVSVVSFTITGNTMADGDKIDLDMAVLARGGSVTAGTSTLILSVGGVTAQLANPTQNAGGSEWRYFLKLSALRAGSDLWLTHATSAVNPFGSSVWGSNIGGDVQHNALLISGLTYSSNIAVTLNFAWSVADTLNYYKPMACKVLLFN